jgi:hypothetical protein
VKQGSLYLKNIIYLTLNTESIVSFHQHINNGNKQQKKHRYELKAALTNDFFFCGSITILSPRLPHSWAFEILDIPHSIVLLWTRDWSTTVTCTWHHTTYTRDKTSTPSAGFEPAIPANKLPQTYALDRAATRIAFLRAIVIVSYFWFSYFCIFKYF